MVVSKNFSSKLIISTILTSLAPLGFLVAVNLDMCYKFIISEFNTDAEKAVFLTDKLIETQISIFFISFLSTVIFSLFVTKMAIRPILSLTKQVSDVRESLNDMDELRLLPKSRYKEINILSMTINELIRTAMEYEVKNSSLHKESITDDLTGLYNRRYFNRYISESVFKKSDKVGAIFIDIDKFKRINDTYGHEVGDSVLKVVSNTIHNTVRNNIDDDNFKVFRYGGEEIVVILQNNKKRDVLDLAEKIRLNIECSKELHNIISEYNVTASLGVSHYPTDAHTVEEIIEHADMALYKSKNSGRNKTTLYSNKMD